MRAEPEIGAERLAGIFTFIQASERLKDTLRTGKTRTGRSESAAEHCWRLSLLTMLLGEELAGHDLCRLLKLCIVHDLGEALSGDVPATEQCDGDGRTERERADMEALCEPLPQDLRDMMLALHDEYAAAATPEAVLAKGFDKIETMLQHLLGNDDPDFDYMFNLTYGRRWTDSHWVLRQLRHAVDAETRQRIHAHAYHVTTGDNACSGVV